SKSTVTSYEFFSSASVASIPSTPSTSFGGIEVTGVAPASSLYYRAGGKLNVVLPFSSRKSNLGLPDSLTDMRIRGLPPASERTIDADLSRNFAIEILSGEKSS